MTDEIRMVIMPIRGKQPTTAPVTVAHAMVFIELQDDIFHHYIYEVMVGWVHLGGVLSLFHPTIIAMIDPEPDTPEDAYDRAMGVIG